jgi:polysaccharide export outer membrane protein
MIAIRKLRCSIGVIMVLAAMLVVAAQGQSATAQSKGKTGAKRAAKADVNSYRIGAGDLLKIVTWKEPDFTLDEILVRTDGRISFPLLNDVKAADRSPEELKKEIEARLKDYVSAPEVTVTVLNPGSKRFYILGEVVNTGEYPLIKQLTVLQAFALAGGFTEWASKKEIILVRRENGKRVVITINYKDLAKGKNLDQNVLIKPDDTIIVP